MIDPEILKTAAVMPMLAHIFGRNKPLPDDLVGAVIVRVGTFEDDSLAETGGLVIDYIPAGATGMRRVVFAFNDEAMWVAGLTDHAPG